jgi:methionyl-tRNA formyltransferase
VTLFEMVDQVDAGDIVDQVPVPIGPDDAIGEVMEAVTGRYLELLERNLPALLAGKAPRRPQDHSLATFTCKRLPEDNRIDWSAPTQRIHDLVRAVTRPYPGAFTTLQGRPLRVWRTRRLERSPRYVGRVPGRVVETIPGEGAVVLTGDGALLVTEVQEEGKEPACASSSLDRPSLTLGR